MTPLRLVSGLWNDFPGELEIYSIALDTRTAPSLDTIDCLLPREREKIARYRFLEDQVRYAQTKTCLRRLLGWTLQRLPQNVPIEHDYRGKPSLSPECEGLAQTIGFNTSHYGEIALIALSISSDNIALAVDVECYRESSDRASLSNFALTNAERTAVAQSHHPLDAFYTHWVVKEA